MKCAPCCTVDGGFILVRADELRGVWSVLAEGLVTLKDFRVYLGCRELVARRSAAGRSVTPTFTLRELAGLVGGHAGACLRASLRRLEKAGLLVWSTHGVRFLEPAASAGEGRALRRLVPFPRRMLRHLAAGCNRATAATVLGHLLRCAFYRRGQVTATGCCKASALAEEFGLDARSVKRARARLVESGWVRPLPTPQWRLNRYGGLFEVDLGWSPCGGVAERSTGDLSPPGRLSTARLSPPVQDKYPLREYKNQNPGAAGPTGVRRRARPALSRVTAEDLRSATRLRTLHAEACSRGRARPGEAGFLAFVTLAEHAKRCATRNAPGLFRWLVERDLPQYATAEDERAAVELVKVSLPSDVADGRVHALVAGVVRGLGALGDAVAGSGGRPRVPARGGAGMTAHDYTGLGDRTRKTGDEPWIMTVS